ncbi:MAG: hypothetical protein K2N95_12775 [Lachnospiraceae bacterium]|nr:hypothetical protein [Lachnospiraceae bacterium]
MKQLKKILYFLLGMLIVFYGFAIVCILNPDISKAVAAILYSDPVSDTVQRVTVETQSDIPDSDFYENGADIEPSDRESSDWSPDEVQAADRDSEVFSGGRENEGIEEGIASDYIPPEESELVIPETVSGRNGYQQVQDEQEQIDDTDAERLQNQLDTGYTGDGLEFNELYYPYYAMLNEKGKHLYRQIYANGNELYQAFAPVESVTAGELRNIFSAVYNDHPELFWMETAYSGKYVRSGQCVEIDLRFNRTARDLENAKARFEDNAEQILSEAQNLSSDYDKEKFVHDALIDRITYNMGAEMNQSAYSALVNGQTVCAGYARAFQYLMQQLGIPCYYCTGFAGESHAWNIIRLDDGFYNVDTTWDDTGNGTYDYFNKTDADYASSHIRRDLSVYLPPCNGQAYRNLEPEEVQESEGSSLRSLADTGLTEDQVFTDLQGYYADCYDQMLRNGRGRYTFYNVLEGDGLVEQWYRDYQYNRFSQAYMEDAMTQIDAASCEITFEVEALQGGRYLIGHELYVR